MHKVFSVGTLRYTSAGLVTLFIWLLWGDFIFILIDQDLPHVFNLKLQEMGASDRTIALMLTSIPQAMVFLVAPAVSMHSDRHRGSRGRRIPYLMWSTPFIGMFLMLIGCYEEMTSLLVGQSQQLTVLGMTFVREDISRYVLIVLIMGFMFTNIFVNTIYNYLFNDVVPKEVMSRFMSLFRIVLYVASMLYNKLIFPISLSHFQIIFILGGATFLIGFVLMCVFVKEGKYAPPAPLVLDSRSWSDVWKVFVGGLATKKEQFLSYSPLRQIATVPLVLVVFALGAGIAIPLGTLCLAGCAVEYATVGLYKKLRWNWQKRDPREYRPHVSGVSKRFMTLTNNALTYAKECFTHQFYIYYFLTTACTTLSWTAGSTFRSLRDVTGLGLSPDRNEAMRMVGDILFWSQMASAIIMWPMGWLADKFNPVRVNVFSSFLVLLPLAAQSVFAFYDFGSHGNLIYLYIVTMGFLPIYAIQNLTIQPMSMMLLPKDRYGQFMSAVAMLGALAKIFGSWLSGEFMNLLEHGFGMGTWRYRYYSVWTIVLQIPALFFLLLLYRQWKIRGGAKGYTPPET